jgi:hypothetical protein
LKTIELKAEGDPNPAMRVGFKFQIVPVAGGSGGVAAYRFVGEDGTTVMTVPASAVRVVEQHDDEAEGGAGRDPETFLTDEEEIELLRALGYEV